MQNTSTHSNRPFVSIILVNYNSSDYTINCVQSIRNYTKGVVFEIVVVDNGSRPDELAKLELVASDPEIKFVRSEINRGFSGGNMLGIEQTRLDADYYFLLNNDTIFLNDVCTELSQYMENHPKVGICTPQTFKGDGSFEASFVYFPTLAVKLLGHGFMRSLFPNEYPLIKHRYEQPVLVPVVTGSAMFVRGKILRELGGLDTGYFLYCEEEDLCQRLRRAGFQAALVPAARFVHYAGGSGEQQLAVRKEFYISLFRYYRNYHTWFERGIFRLLYTLKNGRKVFRNRDFGRVAWFILRGAPERESLRYRQ